MTLNLTPLSNGSDIRGIAISTSKHSQNLTPQGVRHIGLGALAWYKEKYQPQGSLRIAVGHDSRLSAKDLQQALFDGLAADDVTLLDVGLATTPSLFMATQYEEIQADMGIMITASHLPFEYNGFKFFTKDGGLDAKDITNILTLAEKLPYEPQTPHIEKADLLDIYARDMRDKIRETLKDKDDQPLKGRHIVVDAGNGVGGFFATEVLAKLGAKIDGSQFLDPDGTFPNHEPNPDNKEAMASIQKAVQAAGADLGIIFDTDVDRSAVVDKSGMAFNRNNLIALISAVVLREHPGATIVTNSATSEHLRTFIEARGGQQDLYLTGYRNVINRAVDLNDQGIDAQLAIETSGHSALKENYFLDDGAYLAMKLLCEDTLLAQKGQSLMDLIEEMKQPAQTHEIRFEILEEPVVEVGGQIIQAFMDYVDTLPDISVIHDHVEGMRANVSGKYGDGWFLVRQSLHEPLLVWTMENDHADKVSLLVEDLKGFFQERPELE